MKRYYQNPLHSCRRLLAYLGLVLIGLSPAMATAEGIPDGGYVIAIQQTPELIPGSNIADVGVDGDWNSSFTFGDLPSPASSQRMTDNGFLINGTIGSSIPGDTYAGVIGITVANNNFSVNSFNVDAIFGTAGGTFVQFTNDPTLMSGSIDATTGNVVFDPTGRMAAIDGVPGFLGLRWNVNPGETAWRVFTTASTTNSAGTINGKPLVNLGDINGDGRDDFEMVLVSGGLIGEDWGGFQGFSYFEAWRVQVLSGEVVRPNPVVTIDITGGNSQECSTTGGSNITMTALVQVPSDTQLASISWELDGVFAGGGESITPLVALGSHTIRAIAETTDGRIGSGSANVSVNDTQAPTINVSFIDGKGNPVSQITSSKSTSLVATITAQDICDPSPVTSGVAGIGLNNGDTVDVKTRSGTVTLTTSSIALTGTATDGSGNMSKGTATVQIIGR